MKKNSYNVNLSKQLILPAAILVFCGCLNCDKLSAVMVLPQNLKLLEAVQETDQGESVGDWRSLFNGIDLSGWYAVETYDPRKLGDMTAETKQQRINQAAEATQKHWSVKEGVIYNDGTGPFLTTIDEFEDFEIELEYKTVPRADSGVYLKATPQVQIWDSTEESKFSLGADKGSGGLWNNSPGTAGKDPLVLADKPFGEWNHMRIRQIGARTDVWLNDQHVVQHATMENYWNRSLPLIRRGPIQLQTHGGEISWRNIRVREIPAAEANQILAEASNDTHGLTFRSLFNGDDFNGWAGPLDNYEVVDGAIRCRPGKGGTIYTQEEFDDFVVRFEFKLPPGGNNGLAIRYPGTGDTAYVGMCELQVLDDDAPQYAKLDARQYHGSAYGMAAAHRGFLRPTGQWNFQEVTVIGSKIKVELNGTIVLDTDLAEVTELMANRPHPGKDRRRGHFGFAGHSDPVEFRNIEIAPLVDSQD